MKLSTTLTSIAIAASSADAAAKVVPINIARTVRSPPPLHKRATSTFTQNLNNNLTGGGYYADVSVGTPPQSVTLVLDTGSSDVWVLSSNSNLCSSQRLQETYGYCLSTYNSNDSSTYGLVSTGGFKISYVDNSGASGNYIKDDFSIGGTTISQLQMGLATKSTINSGLIGVGFSSNEATTKSYPNIIDVFQSEGLISVKAYSLYLNDYDSSTGTILFGGLDTDKFIGDLGAVPIQKDSNTDDYTSFTVALSSASLNANGSATSLLQTAVPVILDSGTTLTYLPDTVVQDLYSTLNVYDDTNNSGLAYASCSLLGQNVSFTFQFGGSSGPSIDVPVDEVVFDNVASYQDLGLQLPRGIPFSDPCTFGVLPSSDYYLLGDTFLRSAYVVYDLDNLQIALAQANLNSTSSHVVALDAASSSIPDATGVASQVSVTQTATGLPGKGGASSAPGSASATATGTGTTATTSSTSGTGAAATTTSPNAGVRAVPTPDWQAVAVAALASLGFVVGSMVFAI